MKNANSEYLKCIIYQSLHFKQCSGTWTMHTFILWWECVVYWWLSCCFTAPLGCFVRRSHCEEGPGSGRALCPLCSLPPLWEEPWSVEFHHRLLIVAPITVMFYCFFFFYLLPAGVLHGAVVLITELCGRSPETLERFRKVRSFLIWWSSMVYPID